MTRYCKECLPEKKRTSYGPEGGKPICCAMHKSAEMVDVMNKRCEHVGCTSVNPVFGFVLRKGTHCGKHKTPEMVDVVNKRCKHVGCTGLNPVFGFVLRKGTHCRTHKTPKMIDVMHKRCEYAGCTAQPVFGTARGKGTHCRKHKSDEMVDVVHERCDHDECTARPNFGTVRGKGTHCRKHKSDEMIDVRSKRCEHAGCTVVTPVFGIVRGKGTHCRKHKSNEMINVVSKMCEYVGCIVVNPKFGIVLHKGTHCGNHKSDKMVDVMHQRCTECKTTQTNKKDKLCYACRQVQQLGASRKLLRIERRIIAMLILHGTIIDDERTKFNKSIGAACGGYRPDIYIHCGTFILVIEIDENQHRPRYISRIVDGVVTPMAVGSYSPECENVRMMSIVSKEQMPVYFIRINPDKFTIDDKEIRVSFEKRCEALRALIKSVMEGDTPDAWMTVSYLYYDGALERTVTPDLPAGF